MKHLNKTNIILILLIMLFTAGSISFANRRTKIIPTRQTVPCNRLLQTYDRLVHPRQKTRFLQQIKHRDPACLPLVQINKSVQQKNNFLAELHEKNLISQEITQTFTPATFAKAQEEAIAEFGDIRSITFTEPTFVGTEWMETTTTIKTENSTKNYLSVFHWEDNSWKLFGTEEN